MIEGIKIHIQGQEGLDWLFSLARQSQQAFSESAPNTASALYESAKFIETVWKGWTTGNEQIPGVRNIPKPDSKLAETIHTTPNKIGSWEYTISSDSPKMADLQNGKDETIDMKAPDSPWLNGKHSRLNKKDGSPYLIVPFSWGTGTGHFKNIVPQGIQNMLRSRALSKRLATQHTEPNARGEDVLRHEYDWGGRISEEEAQHTDNSGKLTGYDAGMVRMRDDSYKSGNHGTYFTFRVISAKSAADKWIQHRHIDPIDVVGGLKREFEQVVQENVQAAFLSDYQNGF